MKIIDLRSIIVAIYPADEIDFRGISNQPFIENFSKDFGFNQMQVNHIPGISLVFTGGLSKLKSGRNIVIDQISIDTRRVIVTVGN